ncbi:MAG: Tat pathway signal sequence domain protein [Burkholderia sp.]|jgi:succinate dehydrogenase/fumarate reductase flavoprotein subunit
MTKLSKRTFLKTAVASAFGFPAVSAIAKSFEPSMKWDRETDVLVVGFGGAGACAAITAHDSGAKVLIVEKMAEAGGNTAVSAGGFMIPDDAAKAYEYLRGTYQFVDSDFDEALLRTFCEENKKTKEFLKSLDPDIKMFVYGYAGFKNLPGHETIKRYRVKAKPDAKRRGGGDSLFSVLKNAVEKRGIPVLLNSPCVSLIRRNDEVIGATVRNNGKEINICARKGVVLACGGYEFDRQSLQNFTLGTHIGAIGNPGNTGDGLRLAQSMGARIWHMSGYSAFLGVKYPGFKTSVSCSVRGPSWIWVDQHGKRFSNEKIDGHCQLYVAQALDAINHCYPRIPCYLVFDDKALKAGPLDSSLGSGYAINREHHRWSKDLAHEVELGIVKKADTIEELAKQIGVPAENLSATVKRWNSDVKAGKDTEFGRPIKTKAKSYAWDGAEISAPIETAPFYAVTLYPTLVNTQGGPKKNERGQVMDALDKPIPRLYAAGELGSMWGALYQGACNNAESLVFGRITGREVAKESAWH